MAKDTYKSKSGKRGTLAQVVQDPNYNKDTRGDFKGKYHMSHGDSKTLTNEEISAKNAILNAQGSLIKNAEEQPEVIEAQVFNDEIRKFEKRYSEEVAIPPGTLLIRLYKVVPLEGGLLKRDVLTKPSRAANDRGKGRETQDNPFPFQERGIIVNISDAISNNEDLDWPELKVGAEVIMAKGCTRFLWDPEKWVFTAPNAAFKHPDDKRPYNKLGYLLVRTRDIIGIIKNGKV